MAGPTTTTDNVLDEQIKEMYRSLVLDTSAILKSSSLNTYDSISKSIYTVDGVINEILDSKSRELLKNVSLQDLQIREPSSEGLKAVSKFSRLTGDYQHLSLVDLQVLALAYDLETEGCGRNKLDHIRTEPKHMLGKGKLEFLQEPTKSVSSCSKEEKKNEEKKVNSPQQQSQNKTILLGETNNSGVPKSAGTTWAQVVNPSVETLREELSEDDEIEKVNRVDEIEVTEELHSDFPRLSVTAKVTIPPLVEEEEKNGKGQTCPLYSSIRKNYDNIISSQGILNYSQKKKDVNDNDSSIAPLNVITEEVSSNQNKSRIIAGEQFAGQSTHIIDDDDIQGWINEDNLSNVRATGDFIPKRLDKKINQSS